MFARLWGLALIQLGAERALGHFDRLRDELFTSIPDYIEETAFVFQG